MSGKQPSTIFTDQDAAMAAAIAHVFPKTDHHLCLWHIGQNAVKHLGPINKAAEDEAGNKFWADFKSFIYEDRAEIYFTEKCNKLLAKYNLQDNSWMSNLYALRTKWVVVHRDSFTADMHSTQRSEGMNNIFKKRFRRKLGLTKLLVECENVIVDLRSNEKDADFESRRNNPVCYILNLPMLKTAVETYKENVFRV
jgi:zinc finger SWIM domain-containing protein 3